MRFHTFFCILLISTLSCKQNLEEVKDVHVPDGTLNTADQEVQFQPLIQQTINGITFSNDFPAAHLNGVTALSEHQFQLDIHPENAPINDSAWYAFSVLGPAGREIELHLHYENGQHRYHPKFIDTQITPLAPEQVIITADKQKAIFKLTLTGKPQIIAAQEIVTATDIQTWATQLAQHPDVAMASLGTSTEERDIPYLRIGPQSNANVLLIIGRLHPPEVTGSLALMPFVAQLCKPEAQSFREQITTIVVPMINPDGVDRGFWRHNLNGVDLNRDWQTFHQKETQVVRDGLTELLKGKDVLFGIDFHSTHEDIFYVLQDSYKKTPQEYSGRWLDALSHEMPHYTFKVQKVSPEIGISQNWIHQTFQCSAITYEVGDETDRTRLKELAVTSSEILMNELTK